MTDRSVFENVEELTISIVTYNSANEIDILMTSLQNCSFFNKMTIYVVDNASHDNTVLVLKEMYPFVRIIRSNENLGFGRGHNLVITNINSKYHIIINPDIDIPSDSIAKVKKFMDENPDVVAMTPIILNEDGTQQFLPKKNPSMKYLFGGMFENQFRFCKKLREEYTLQNETIKSPIDIEFCTGAFMVTRTEALHQVGGFDERYFLHFEDADLTRELRKIGRTVFNPEIMVIHKWHRENRKFSKSFWIALKSMFSYMWKWSITNA